MTEDEKRADGGWFFPADPELKAIKRRAHKLSQDYNCLYEDETHARKSILQELLGELGEGSFLQGPITFHYGCHTRIGHHVFINFNFTVQDDGEVVIGDHCDIGPNVTIVTPVHPMLPEERVSMPNTEGVPGRYCVAKPVHIGDRCWLGANVVICPGVSIGSGCVIGAGSVVTRDIPPRCFAAGNPARVIRHLTEADSVQPLQEQQDDYPMAAPIPHGECNINQIK